MKSLLMLARVYKYIITQQLFSSINQLLFFSFDHKRAAKDNAISKGMSCYQYPIQNLFFFFFVLKKI